MRRQRRLFQIADQQHGLVRIEQAHAAGFDRYAISRLTQQGPFERLGPRLLRQRGSPRTTAQDHLAAAYDAGRGAVVSDLSAAAMWALPGCGVQTPVELARLNTRSGARPHLGVIRPVRFLEQDLVTTIDGVPVITLPVVLYRLAALLTWARFERIADTVCGRSPQVLAALHLLMPRLSARGRNGITAMREFLGTRPIGYQGPHSALEARVLQILREAGEPLLRPQVDLGGQSWIGRVDFRDPHSQLVLEVQSRTYHSSRSDRIEDDARFRRLRDAGLSPVGVDDDLVWHRPWEVLEIVRQHRRTLLS